MYAWCIKKTIKLCIYATMQKIFDSLFFPLHAGQMNTDLDHSDHLAHN